MLLRNHPSTLSASVDRRSSLLLGFSVFGTRKTSRSMVNSWVSLYFSLMRRIVCLIWSIDSHVTRSVSILGLSSGPLDLTEKSKWGNKAYFDAPGV
ncbi:hypothetical protein F2Q69_00031906 [Brassica cretica]|uniref:Uncharacterized protein n=1 Tax=Brassica cretica TaxID=69181 RepID=A0A8S9RYF3_BRACR|nr:hypothetical protein F2Q69_00031906 [Brassica cretica]